MTARGPSYEGRRSALLAGAAEAGLEAVAVVPGPNMRYLTGLSFHLSERPVLALLRAGEPLHIVVPRLEAGKLDAFNGVVRRFVYADEEGPASAVRDGLASLALSGAPCGVEERRMRFLEMDLMAHSGQGPSLWGADEVFGALRTAKDPREVAAMARAVEIAETAIGRVLPGVAAGQTERQVASRLVAALLEAESEPDLPFLPAVASGPQGALPHAVPTDRPLAPGDLVVIDWGARHDGYCSDITRTFAVAGADVAPELRAAYEAVRRANGAARHAARAGATGADVDEAARSVIDEAGFGAGFIHRTGHGLGLEVHEEPEIKATNRAPLVVGAAFTVEPGVYLPGVGGVRIEDDVLITAEGSKSLTGLRRDLQPVG